MMHRLFENNKRPWLMLALVAGALSTPGIGHALTLWPGPACPNSVMNDHVQLTGNVNTNTGTNVCGTGVCFCMGNGKDLNLNGYTITCTSNCGQPVVASAAGTDVTNGTIFTLGVAVRGATSVSNVDINASQAIQDEGDRLKTVTDNFITCPYGSGFGARCVDATMPRSTDDFSGNTISVVDTALRIVGATSGNGPTVENNYFGNSFPNVPTVVQLGAAKSVRMYGNQVAGNLPFLVDNSSLATDLDVWNSNVCADDYYCPPLPTCANGGDPVCHPDGVFCMPN